MNRTLLAIVCACLSGCASYYDTAPDPAINSQIEQRLQQAEGLEPEKLSAAPPKTVEQALPEFKARRPDTHSALPTVSPEAPGGTPAKPPPDSKPLTIAEVRALGLQNNLDLQIAFIDPAIASTAVQEEEAKFDDLIFARAKFSRKDTPAYDNDVVRFSTLDPTSPLRNQVAKPVEIPQLTELFEAEAGVTVPLRTGGKLTFSVPFDNKQTFRSVTTDQVRSALRFSFSQPLLRDAGIRNNVAGIRIARYEQQAANVKTRLQAIRVLAAIDKAYWSLYTAWGELDVRRQQYENASNNLTMVRRRVEEGLTAAIEINRAEIGVAERMEALIVAETNLKLRQRQLKLLLNDKTLTLDSPTTLIPQTSPLLLSFAFDRERLAEQALAGRLELLELELKLAADVTKIDYLRNQTLPLFMLDYSYASLGRDNTLGRAFNDTFSDNFSDWSIGFRFELPLTNELRRARLAQAVQERLQRLTTKQLRELTVRREIYDALDQIQQNWQRILAARQNVLLAGLNYDAELKQFNEGLRTMTEVLETLTRLGESQIREVRAISDYQVSLIDLAFATGTLLGYSKVAF